MKKLDVIKIWWENAWCDLQTTVWFVKWNSVNDQTLVVSAMRNSKFNTTDELKNLAEYLNSSNLESAINTLEKIFQFHEKALLAQWWDKIVPLVKSKFSEIKEYLSDNLWKNLSEENDYVISLWERKISLLWFWEDISAFVHAELLKINGIDSEVIVTDDFEIFDENNYFLEIISHFTNKVSEVLNNWRVPVVPWFIWNIPWWILNKIDRWYTDATASMVALSLEEMYKNICLSIFKSVDGILACDPGLFKDETGKSELRDTEKIKLISHLDYLTARELTWWSIGGKAKFLHEYALSEEIMKSWIELKIVNPQKPHLWTVVNADKNSQSDWVEIVNKRDGISFIKVTKAAFSEGVWDLEKIFQIVKNEGYSIDMVITSETQVSFSLELNDPEKLNLLKSVIEQEFFDNNISDINFVEISNNMSLVHCIWQNLDENYQLVLAYWIIALQWEGIQVHHFWWERGKWAMIFAVEQKDAKLAAKKLARQFNLIQ